MLCPKSSEKHTGTWRAAIGGKQMLNECGGRCRLVRGKNHAAGRFHGGESSPVAVQRGGSQIGRRDPAALSETKPGAVKAAAGRALLGV